MKNKSLYQDQEGLKLNEKIKSIDANTSITAMLELYDKDDSMNNYKHIETNKKNSLSTETEDIKY